MEGALGEDEDGLVTPQREAAPQGTRSVEHGSPMNISPHLASAAAAASPQPSNHYLFQQSTEPPHLQKVYIPETSFVAEALSGLVLLDGSHAGDNVLYHGSAGVDLRRSFLSNGIPSGAVLRVRPMAASPPTRGSIPSDYIRELRDAAGEEVDQPGAEHQEGDEEEAPLPAAAAAAAAEEDEDGESAEQEEEAEGGWLQGRLPLVSVTPEGWLVVGKWTFQLLDFVEVEPMAYATAEVWKRAVPPSCSLSQLPPWSPFMGDSTEPKVMMLLKVFNDAATQAPMIVASPLVQHGDFEGGYLAPWQVLAAMEKAGRFINGVVLPASVVRRLAFVVGPDPRVHPIPPNFPAAMAPAFRCVGTWDPDTGKRGPVVAPLLLKALDGSFHSMRWALEKYRDMEALAAPAMPAPPFFQPRNEVAGYTEGYRFGALATLTQEQARSAAVAATHADVVAQLTADNANLQRLTRGVAKAPGELEFPSRQPGDGQQQQQRDPLPRVTGADGDEAVKLDTEEEEAGAAGAAAANNTPELKAKVAKIHEFLLVLECGPLPLVLIPNPLGLALCAREVCGQRITAKSHPRWHGACCEACFCFLRRKAEALVLELLFLE